jgi:hypothetical protein
MSEFRMSHNDNTVRMTPPESRHQSFILDNMSDTESQKERRGKYWNEEYIQSKGGRLNGSRHGKNSGDQVLAGISPRTMPDKLTESRVKNMNFGKK